MPNRIIKESICTSKDIDHLKPEEEVFFYRIIVNCDDYGRMEADPVIIRSKCFPRRTDTIKIPIIVSWLKTLVDNEMIVVYEIDGNVYLELTAWDKHQQVRASKSKYPAPDNEGAQQITFDSNGNQLISSATVCPRIRNRIRKRKRDMSETYSDAFEIFWNLYKRKEGKKDAFKAWNARIAEDIPLEHIIQAATNYMAKCKAEKTEPKYIKQPKTFLGPNGHIEENLKTSDPTTMDNQPRAPADQEEKPFNLDEYCKQAEAIAEKMRAGL